MWLEDSHSNEVTEIKADSKGSYIAGSSFNCLPRMQPAEWCALL